MSLKRIFIITGDASGDLHGSYVVKAFRQKLPHVEIEAIGGHYLAETGIPIFYNQRKMGALGLSVLRAVPSHFFLGKRLVQHLKQWKPDAVLLIDYGIFNLWIAKHLKKLGIRVFYYVPPQVWASRRWRIQTIKRYVDHVFCIFPFEEPLYKSYGIPVTFVGHPLAEQLSPAPDRAGFCKAYGLNPDLPIIGVFPGSRTSEVKHLMAPMIKALPLIEASLGQRYQFLLARSPGVSDEVFEQAIAPVREVTRNLSFHILPHQNHAILALSRAALVASGTVTLEAALYCTPVVIAYPLSGIAHFFFKTFSYVRHIGLPNLLATSDDAFLPELIRDNVTPEKLAESIKPFLSEDTPEWQRAQQEFMHIQKTLGYAPASLNVVKGLCGLMDGALTEESVGLAF